MRFKKGDIIIYRGNRFDDPNYGMKKHKTLRIGNRYQVTEVWAQINKDDRIKITDLDGYSDRVHYNYYSSVHFDLFEGRTTEQKNQYRNENRNEGNTMFEKENVKFITISFSSGRTRMFNDREEVLASIKEGINKNGGPYRLFVVEADYKRPEIQPTVVPVSMEKPETDENSD